MYNSECQIGDDGDSLTEMDEPSPAELLSRHDIGYQRNVSWIRDDFDQRTDLYEQFWDLRYQVQKFHHPSHDQVEKDISFRLTALNQIARSTLKPSTKQGSAEQSKHYWSGAVRCDTIDAGFESDPSICSRG